jgi:predicted small metal-binding protein
MKPTNTTNSTMSVNNATNEGKKIEYDVRQQVEDIQGDAHNTTNIYKDYANEIKSDLKDSSN